MDGTNKIAAVILNYNDAETTLNLAKTVVNYSSLDYVIVVDNNSTDNSYQILDNANHNNKYILLKTDRNGGYGYGNNFGVRYAIEVLCCSYALIANPDTEIDQEVILALKNFLDHNEDCVFVAPVQKLLTHDGRIAPPWRLCSKTECVLSTCIFLSKFWLKNRIYYNNLQLSTGKLEVDVVPGALLMIRCDFFDLIGGYDEDIFLYNEENCLAMKAKKYNKKSYILTDYIYIHHHSVSISHSFNTISKRNKLLRASKLLYIKKYYHVGVLEESFIKLFFMLCGIESVLIGLIRG